MNIEVIDCEECKRLARGLTWIPVDGQPPKCPEHSKPFKFNPRI